VRPKAATAEDLATTGPGRYVPRTLTDIVLDRWEGRTPVYSGIVAMALVAMFAVVFLYVLHRATSVAARPVTVLPAQSGWLPEEHALSRFHARWYLASIVFLAFDVEMLFMYPWAVVVIEKGISAVAEMFLFLGALLVAVAWAWREGAFRWA
jgi:NADH-quinone oxidoreductase subunit A